MRGEDATLGEARREVTIVNQRGLHARASAKFVAAVAAMNGCQVASCESWTRPSPSFCASAPSCGSLGSVLPLSSSQGVWMGCAAATAPRARW